MNFLILLLHLILLFSRHRCAADEPRRTLVRRRHHSNGRRDIENGSDDGSLADLRKMQQRPTNRQLHNIFKRDLDCVPDPGYSGKGKGKGGSATTTTSSSSSSSSSKSFFSKGKAKGKGTSKGSDNWMRYGGTMGTHDTDSPSSRSREMRRGGRRKGSKSRNRSRWLRAGEGFITTRDAVFARRQYGKGGKGSKGSKGASHSNDGHSCPPGYVPRYPPVSNKAELRIAIRRWITSDGTYTDLGLTINDWDVSAVTDFSFLFADEDTFNDPLSNWETAQVTSMSSMFQRASLFDQEIGGWVSHIILQQTEQDHSIVLT